MMGISQTPQAIGQRIQPLEAYGVKLMSMAFLNPGDKPLVWRGPMLNSVIQQFLRNVDWGELDYLSDRSSSRHRRCPVNADSDHALDWCSDCYHAFGSGAGGCPKAANMFEQVREPVLGIVENMSYLEHNGEKLYIFGKGGGAKTAELMRVPLLAEIPLDPATREGGDAGKPIASQGASAQSKIFEQLAHTIIESAEATKSKQRPTITIAD